MEKKVIARKPKWLRRISSFILDFIVMVVLALLISFITNPICNKIYHGDQAQEVYNNKALETKLFYINEQNQPAVIDNLKIMDTNITYFYEHCTENKLSEYIDKKKNSDLFYFDEVTQNYIEKDYNIEDSNIRVQYTIFYNDVINYCIENYVDKYLLQDEAYKNALITINKISYLSLLMCSFISMLVVYLLIPMILKDYKTIGKLALKLKVASKVSVDLKPTRLQIVFRQLVLILFEFILSIATINIFGFILLPITLIISIVMVFVSKYNQSFHDFCCSTFLIDDYPQISSIDEGNKYEILFTNVKEVEKNGK